jgi:hypothetical protein
LQDTQDELWPAHRPSQQSGTDPARGQLPKCLSTMLSRRRPVALSWTVASRHSALSACTSRLTPCSGSASAPTTRRHWIRSSGVNLCSSARGSRLSTAVWRTNLVGAAPCRAFNTATNVACAAAAKQNALAKTLREIGRVLAVFFDRREQHQWRARNGRRTLA